MFNKLFNSRTKTVTFAAFLLACSTLGSKFLALIRDRLLAGSFGAGPELDIYFTAFRVPDFVYGILVLGGISAVFVPVFSGYFKEGIREDRWPEAAIEFANNILNCFLLLMICLCVLLAIFAPIILRIIVPGFNEDSMNLAVLMTRIMFLSPILLGISNFFSGILHFFNRFLIYSLSPILYNLGIIIGILFFVPFFGVIGLSFGVILGAFFHLAIQIPAARLCGFQYRPIFNFKFPGVVKAFKLMIPRAFGSAVNQVNLIVITAIASTLTAGSIAVFNFAHNLNYIPVGLIGVSFALASFPSLSKSWAQGQKEEFMKSFSSIFRQVFYLVIPVSVLMFLLRAQIVRIILGTGQFGWWETKLTAASLGLFCVGIFAAALIPLLSRTFYSFHNTKTPVAIGVFTVGLNIIFSFLFVKLLSFPNFFQETITGILKIQGVANAQVAGLPLAMSLAVIFQFFLLLFFLRKKTGGIRFGEIWGSFKKIAVCSVLFGIVAYFVLRFAVLIFDTQTFFGVLFQVVLTCLVGGAFYILITFYFRTPEAGAIWSLISKRFNRGKL